MIWPVGQNSLYSSGPKMARASLSVERGCRPLEMMNRMSCFSTPTLYRSCRMYLMDSLRWLVGCSPPLTRSGTTKTTLLPLWASSLTVGMPMGWSRLSR